MTLATMPALTVEIKLDGTWTDITNYVRNGSTRIGRRDEMDVFQPGTISLTVDNRDRRFDPLNTVGPYYGKLFPGPANRIRVKATWNSTVYDVFTGYVDGWGLSPNIDGDSTLTLEGYDYLGICGTQAAGRDALSSVIGNDSSSYDVFGTMEVWLPLGGTDQVAKDFTRAKNRDYTYTIAAPRQGDSISRYVSGGSSEFDGTYGLIGPPVPWERQGLADAVTTIFVKTSTAGSSGQLNPILASASSPTARLGVDDQGRFAFIADGISIHSGLPGNDDNWHCVQLVHNSVDTLFFYVDGYEIGTVVTTTADTAPWQLIGFAAPGSGDDPYFTGSLAHFVAQSALTNNDFYHWYGAGLAGRFRKYAGLTYEYGVQATLLYIGAIASSYPPTSFDVGTVNLVGLKFGGTTLDLMYQMMLAERGRIFIDQSGTLVFHDRAHDTTATRSVTSQATFADTSGASVIPISAIGAIRTSARFTAQGITINLPDGQSLQRYQTASWVDASYGGDSGGMESFDLPLSQSDGVIWADAYMSQYSNSQIRIDEWSVSPQGKPSVAYPVCLGSQIGDRVTIQITPNNVGSQITQDFMIEQIAHEFTPEQWRTTFSGSPSVTAWTLEDATYGLLEQTTILG
jgi:hypothetical protein